MTVTSLFTDMVENVPFLTVNSHCSDLLSTCYGTKPGSNCPQAVKSIY